MYEYYTYLRWKYKLPSIVVLGIFVGDKPAQLFNTYTANDYGVHLNFTFPTYTIADQDEVTLLSDSNPFALAVLANLYVIKSKNDPKLRFEFKRKLVDHILEQQLSLDNFRNLLNFAFIFIKLPTDLEEKIEDILYNITINNDKMTHRARPKPKDYVGFIIEARHIMETGKFSKELQDKIDEMERNALKGPQQITEKAQQVQEKAMRTQEEAMRTQEEAMRTQEKAMRTQEEAMRTQEEAMRAKEEAQRTQEEAHRTQEEAQRKQEEAQRAIRTAILLLHKQSNMSAEELTISLETDVEFVNKVLSEA